MIRREKRSCFDREFKVRASRILSFEGSVTKLRKILHVVQDRPGTLNDVMMYTARLSIAVNA
jgi:hypothetical protein